MRTLAASILGAMLLALGTFAKAQAGTGVAAPTEGGFVVFIASRGLGLQGVSSAQIRSLYLGTARTLEGKRVSTFHLSADHPARRLVERALLGKEGTELREYWINLRLQGGDADEPRVFQSPRALAAVVARSSDGLAYVPLESVGDAPVTILRLDAVSPLGVDAAPHSVYPLRLPPGAAPEHEELGQ